MRVVRILVATLLIASVALSYTQMDSFEETFCQAQVTSLSTSYSVWTTPVTRTRYATTYVTSLVQTDIDGPYLKCEGEYHYYYDVNSLVITRIMVTRKITNLMKVRVIKGRIIGEVRDSKKSEETVTPFWEIKPGETVTVQQGIGLQKEFVKDVAKFYFVKAEFECEGLLTETPVIFTEFMTGTRTYVVTTTYTQAHTPSASAVGDNTTTFIAIVVACVIVGAIVMWVRKPKAQTPEPSMLGRTVPQELAAYCIHCGSRIAEGSRYCAKCGKEQK